MRHQQTASGELSFIPCAAADGAARLIVILLFGFFGFAPSTNVIADSPAPEALSRYGTPGLALRLLDRRQAQLRQDPQAWWQLELQRLGLLSEWRQWARGARRLAEVPADLPAEIANAAATLRVRFLLEEGEGAAARDVLRALFWRDGTLEADDLSLWRRLLIRSYLVDHLVDEAEVAVRRYQQDQQDSGRDWQALRARVLLQAGRPQEALPLLLASTADADDPLVLMAELRGEVSTSESIYQRAETQARNPQRIPGQRALYWLIAADAATAQGSTARVARAYDEALRLVDKPQRLAEFYPIDGDALWQAYDAHGERIGNSQRLLIGNDPAWFEQAEAALPRYPIRARALLATLARTTPSPEVSAQAMTRLAELLAQEEQGTRLLRMLFLHAERYPEPAGIPEAVRYLLLDDSLNRGDITLASRLLRTLSRPPAGADDFRWGLRRARVLVMGGEVAAGAEAVAGILRANTAMQTEQLDRVMQIVFDLQAVGAHPQVLGLLEQIGARELTPDRQREILFWMADSRKALAEYDEAARLYLASAQYLEGQFGDPWGQTARYNAAEALALAGLVDDARRLYAELLRLTEDPNRQSVLRQKLQQLWLQPSASDNVAADPQ